MANETLRKAIIFKPLDDIAFAMFARMSDAEAVKAATLGMETGVYDAKVMTPPMADAEAVFDFINLESKHVASMNPGDVIVWANGQREVCLSMGWAPI